MTLPADSHVHSEWSWDAPDGSMEQTCARAVAIGLPAVAFTEHADYTTWTDITDELDADRHLKSLLRPDRSLTPPIVDLDGYLECLHRCRDRFPELTVISGVELGEPHWHGDAITQLLKSAEFERVLGSQHCLPVGMGAREVADHFRLRPAADVLRGYLAEVVRLIESCDAFMVLAHIDYAIRDWPAQSAPFDPTVFEDEFRQVLKALSASDRVLEVNTRAALYPAILKWWRDEGGQAVSFGSDAHSPDALGHEFAAATAMVEAHGFRPGRHPADFWTRPGQTR
jgi:histidinol-phosphatase (PHP family)